MSIHLYIRLEDKRSVLSVLESSRELLYMALYIAFMQAFLESSKLVRNLCGFQIIF